MNKKADTTPTTYLTILIKKKYAIASSKRSAQGDGIAFANKKKPTYNKM